MQHSANHPASFFFYGHSQIFYQFIFLLNRVVLFIKEVLVVKLQNVIKMRQAKQVYPLQERIDNIK